MSKGKKRCFFCQCLLGNQNRDIMLKGKSTRELVWVDCCHGCKAKQEKKHPG